MKRSVTSSQFSQTISAIIRSVLAAWTVRLKIRSLRQYDFFLYWLLALSALSRQICSLKRFIELITSLQMKDLGIQRSVVVVREQLYFACNARSLGPRYGERTT